MGYDMYMENPRDPAMSARRKEVEDDFAIVLSLPHNREAWTDAEAEVHDRWMNASDPTYFRANIFSMAQLREMMHVAGMLVDTDIPCAKALDDGPIISADWEKDGIPTPKLCSNDGWLVTARECQAALDRWQDWQEWIGPRNARTEVNGVLGSYAYRWNEWLRWLSNCAKKADGFRVW